MFRTLLAGTALAGLVTSAAIAQDAAAPAAPVGQTASQAAGTVDYVRRLEANQTLASDLTGIAVYETVAPDARPLGEIRDFLVGDGRLAGVVIETSGLDQRRTVAAAADKVAWTRDGDRLRAVLRASPSELEAAPAFAGHSVAEAARNGATPHDPFASDAAVAGSSGKPAGRAAAGGEGYFAALADGQRLSQDIIGSNVYSDSGDDAATVGSVNDLVLTPGGAIPVAVVGVGGFLGIGAKNVGVPYRSLSLQLGHDGEPRLVMAATKEQLTNAPTFDEGDATANHGASAMPVPNTDPATTASTGASNDVSSLKPVAGAELTADNLKGIAVYGPNDQAIGKVRDIALTADGRVDAVVVDVGGFLGIGSKSVAVAMENLRFMRDTNGTINIYTQFTQEQLKSAPEFSREGYAQNRGTMRLAPTADAASPAAGGPVPVQ